MVKEARRRVKIILSYDGTAYQGWQIQAGRPDLRTIQGTIEKGLTRLTGAPVRVIGASRTDAGVHARGQVAHFETESSIPTASFPAALNSVLPQDIRILAAEEVSSSFHAQYSALGKSYLYTIDRHQVPDVFRRHYALHVPYELNLAAMQRAADFFVGTHDFRSFCASGSSVKTFTRTVTHCQLVEQNSWLYLKISANGFLYNMVRIIIGTLLEVGRGKLAADAIPSIIAGRDRTLAGPTAPPHGLCLWQVEYHEGF
jgi:tRNA pseudouridine38-40 synthase